MNIGCALIIGILGAIVSGFLVWYSPDFQQGLMGYLGIAVSILFVIFNARSSSA